MGEQGLYEFHEGSYKVQHMHWSVDKAKEVLQTWQRKFTQEVRNVAAKNVNKTNSEVHPFSSASLLDLLQEFSEISTVRVVLGYMLMVSF